MLALEDGGAELRRLIKTDPDTRVRRRAQLVLLLAEGEPVPRVARMFHTAAQRVGHWRSRYGEPGRAGLADHRLERARPAGAAAAAARDRGQRADSVPGRARAGVPRPPAAPRAAPPAG